MITEEQFQHISKECPWENDGECQAQIYEAASTRYSDDVFLSRESCGYHFCAVVHWLIKLEQIKQL